MLFFGSIYRRNNKVLFGQESSKDISEMKRSIIFRFLVAVLCAAGCTSEKVADVLVAICPEREDDVMAGVLNRLKKACAESR